MGSKALLAIDNFDITVQSNEYSSGTLEDKLIIGAIVLWNGKLRAKLRAVLYDRVAKVLAEIAPSKSNPRFEKSVDSLITRESRF